MPPKNEHEHEMFVMKGPAKIPLFTEKIVGIKPSPKPIGLAFIERMIDDQEKIRKTIED
jgi:hypothetical protein